MLKTISFYGTFAFLGRFPMPGTLASLAICPIFILSTPFVNLRILALIGCSLFVSGWIFTFIYIRGQEDKDPREVTIDEIAGMWIALCFIPLEMVSILFCFLIFRILDIFKPPPIRTLENWTFLPFSLRVMLDDLVAGLAAGIITLLFVQIGILSVITREIGFLFRFFLG